MRACAVSRPVDCAEGGRLQPGAPPMAGHSPTTLDPELYVSTQANAHTPVWRSYIGFVLGLTDFFADAFQLPGRRQGPLPYAATLLVPFGVAVTNPGIFLKALDAAGAVGWEGDCPFANAVPAGVLAQPWEGPGWVSMVKW